MNSVSAFIPKTRLLTEHIGNDPILFLAVIFAHDFPDNI